MKRLKKGAKVDVIKENDYPVSWRVSKMLSSNGHMDPVQHASNPCMAREHVVKTVSRKFVIGKSSTQAEDVIASRPSTYYHHKMNVRTSQINYYTNLHDEASRSLKRTTPYCSSVIEAHNEHAQKIRAIEKDGKKQKQKVDAVSYPREFLGVKNMHTCFDSSDSDACSIGSCSVTFRRRNNFCIPSIPFSCRELDSACSDAESCYVSGSGGRKSSAFPIKEEVEGSIRRLELHAYQRTLEALYACGPLSWEQEALLTNLRIMLHISNDEHLTELKNLIDSKTVINFR